MKRLALLFAATCVYFSLKSQVVNNLVVFNNDPEPFTLILNGEVQNATPATNVRVVGLTLKKYQVRLVFQNPKIKEHNTTLTFFSTGTECVFALNRHGKKKYTMDYLSEKPMPQGNSSQTTNNEPVNSQIQETPTPQPENKTTTDNSYTPSSLPPIPQQDYLQLKNNMNNKVDEILHKVSLVEAMGKNSFTCQQIAEILNLFKNNNLKMEVAKQAFLSASDPANFSQVISTFSNAADQTQLQDYIQSVRK